MIATTNGPGAPASATEAGCDCLAATSHSAIKPTDLRAQRLVRVHHVQPAPAPIVAARVGRIGPMIGNSPITAQGRAPAETRHNDAPKPSPRAMRPETHGKPMHGQPSTRAGAITAFCRSCGYDPMDRGTWREQIFACPAGDCPLHRFRPMARGVASGTAALAALRSRLKAEGGQLTPWH